VTYVFEQRSIASLMILTALAGAFGTPPIAFMLPALARVQLDGGGGTLGALTASIGLGSLLGSAVLLVLARRPNKGEPVVATFLLTAMAVAAVGVSHSLPLSLGLGILGGFCGVVFVGLSTVVVQTAASNSMRARVSAIWAAAFVGLLPLGGLITAALTAAFGPGGAVLIDGLAMLIGGAVVIARRPEVMWLGCAALPEACIAATDPAAVALQAAIPATTAEQPDL
jgi:MFS family permease